LLQVRCAAPFCISALHFISERNIAMRTIAINPLRCRVWNLHSRLDESLTEESCRSQIASFEKHGQLIPALGRRLRGNPDYDVELIYGARRLFVARHLNVPLMVELREITDRDGIVAMDLENRLRQDVSAYERGVSYDRWLREGYFESQDEIARSLQVSPAQVSRLLKLARLPPAVTEAFGNPTDICEVWGAELGNLLKDAQTERRLLQAARNIAAVSPRPPGSEIYKQLCGAARADLASKSADRIVKDERGAELFRVKHQRDSIVFSVSMDLLCRETLRDIERTIAGVFEPIELGDDPETMYGDARAESRDEALAELS
jgi:ParB/RepB/Spo0J family partition protein